MKDRKGKVIYVGKARSLADRVKSHFQDKGRKSSRLASLVSSIESIVTENEMEALILEANLIKEYKPKFNIRLKDDKAYPFLKITQEEFPRLEIARRVKEDGAKYFGPYTSSKALRETIRLIKKVFEIRTCRKKIEKEMERPCLNHFLQQCLAPCVRNVSQKTYSQAVQRACLFLSGKGEGLIEELSEKMRVASDKLQFEEAARIRDQISALMKVLEKQRVVDVSSVNRDFVGVSTTGGLACAVLLSVREGKLVTQEHFLLEGDLSGGESYVISSFLKQYYIRAPFIPGEIFIECEVDEREILENWLRERRGGEVLIQVPEGGKNLDLIRLAKKNAEIFLSQKREGIEYGLMELKESLKLPRVPIRIEAFDISNLKGSHPAASMVVFEDGKPKQEDYRHFRIKTVSKQDDTQMLQEVLRRRYTRLLNERTPLPNLILVDGGKPQVGAASFVLRELGLENIPVIGLAKGEEKIFTPKRSLPIRLPSDSLALHLLERVRDEAHRFAHRYHLKLRKKGVI
jgi:excinuclease ABC subunit C